jgi:hypothetical protein
VITTWNEILPIALCSLTPKHREMIGYMMNLPGRRKPSGLYAKEVWNLSRDQFFTELGYALDEIRRYLKRHGLTDPGDLMLE